MFFYFSVCALILLLWVRRLRVCIVCILFVDTSLYASENKGNASNYIWFHLVVALSWLQTLTGVVSYKIYALTSTFFFFFPVWNRWRLRRQGGKFLFPYPEGRLHHSAYFIHYALEKPSVPSPHGSVLFRAAVAFTVHLALLHEW